MMCGIESGATILVSTYLLLIFFIYSAFLGYRATRYNQVITVVGCFNNNKNNYISTSTALKKLRECVGGLTLLYNIGVQ